jgi:uncharacterized repeat protein (TIGR01451 family)
VMIKFKTLAIGGTSLVLMSLTLIGCQQAKDKNVTSFLPGPMIGVQNPNTEPGGTGVGLPSTPPIGSVPTTQPSPLVPPPVSAPTIPPLPTPNPSPSIVGLPPGPLAAPTFTKSFSPSTTSVGVPVTLRFTITNNSGIQLTGLNFADNLPTGLFVANPPNLTNTCSGTPNAPPGGDLITLSSGTLAANATCAVTVQVVASAPGTYTNPPVTLTSAQAPAVQSAPVSLTVNQVAPPTFTKSFSPSTAAPGTSVVVVFTITNNAPVPLSGLNFIDVLPDGLRITPGAAAVTSNTCGGTLTAPPSSLGPPVVNSTTIVLQNGTLAPNSSCVVSVPVQQIPPAAAAQYTNLEVTLFSSEAPPVQSNRARVDFN